ncbi:hypothetical protein ROLI_024920 [Roseobacter fucihabitans]|uniref:Uncharacterized protein n=1 Tax=Roseobacter fucihabitans TaxID=1537242 RepID=A0ABZ2BTX0_9RHOB|nr:hypothetical protein [Roseobacter litoralis]MBC6965204.1 hypothetical protein [Roseobacter litoralis]
MNIYTLQVGSGQDNDMQSLVHSETVGGEDLTDAIGKAKKIVRSGTWGPDANLVRLLHETGEDSKVMCFRPMEAVRDA